MLKIYTPEVFQGSMRKENYFEGWYFKHVSDDQQFVYAFIPGVSLAKNDSHSFIQIINGITGDTQYVAYPKEKFQFERDRLEVRVGDSVFTENYIELHIDDPKIAVKGRLDYNDLSKYPKSLISPGIMGWYSFMPFMECYHGVVSANHNISGALLVNDALLDFDKGKGYIEKDWGTSFPECWIWLQSNSFEEKDASVFVSVAKIPWMGKFFMGFIAFLYYKGRFYKFATYNQSKLVYVKKKHGTLEFLLKNRRYSFSVSVHSKNSGELIAPHQGLMTRRIKESIDSEVEVELKGARGNVIFSSVSKSAGLEVIEKIFDYL